VAPQPVTPQLLQRSRQISAKLAKAIVVALEEGGALDEVGPWRRQQGVRLACGAKDKPPLNWKSRHKDVGASSTGCTC
jgi:hypothetical protein